MGGKVYKYGSKGGQIWGEKCTAMGKGVQLWDVVNILGKVLIYMRFH